MSKRKSAKIPIEFYNWLNLRKINIEREIGRKITYADAMRVIGKTPNLWIDDELLKEFFSKKRRKIPNVLI